MNREYDKNIRINDECFDSMREDADLILQRLLADMVDKRSQSGSMTIKIDVTLLTEFINDYDQFGGLCGGHDALKPMFEHKISSVVQIKNDTKGQSYSEYLELHYDEESKQYILVPIQGAQQMNMFEEQVVAEEDAPENCDGDADEPETLEEPETWKEPEMNSTPEVVQEQVEDMSETAEPLPFWPDGDEESAVVDDDDYADFEEEFASSMNPPETYPYDEPEEYL